MIATASSLLLLLSLQLPGGGDRVEPWSDERLEVRDGLAVWLDANVQARAYAKAGRPPPADGTELGVWFDASGRRRDFIQREHRSQPRIVVVGSGNDRAALVRFDGVDDVLQSCGSAATLAEFTLFVHAAARTNAGGFRAFVAGNATGRNDYQSGFTVDFGWPASARVDALNVEGLGFGGAVDLLNEPFEFGEFHTLAVTCRPGVGGVALAVDGREQGRRFCEPSANGSPRIRCDELSVGARFYSNTSDVPCVTGFLDGDIAEVLLYERALSNKERASVERYLGTKHAVTARLLASSRNLRRVALKPVKPAPVQFMVPGFTAQPLPVDLPNVNNLRYREDGTLVALGYDGNVWLLDDRDGDGLEETVRRYFENRGSIDAPIGMALAPRGKKSESRADGRADSLARGSGVYVACKGKLLLLADRDGDDVAESETVVASGWPQGSIPHNVDALGVALAPDGRLFVGLGTSDYTNGYLLDGGGVAHYDLASERGTILEIAPDHSSRRIFCTGIRFPVALAFNRAGDLFATDQEGATWLANGNPFDELLHLQEGRHYGFPPRHPKHLPGVVDEPSVFDYGPQHESTCGLCFDEPDEPDEADEAAGNGRVFGPASFEGDALVTGYSRGKLFRTELVKSRAGYVARNHLLARFDMLACDAALSPRGDLMVALHGGSPDWGSGPSGAGVLQRLRFAEPERPQPLFAWAAGPREVRVAFDRPLDPVKLQGALAQARIEFGEAVAPADRLEVHRPGYAVVERQLAAPRYELAVESLRLVDERRSLSLRTASHALALPHAVQLPSLDLAYDLAGVEAEWRSSDGAETWSGWLPHIDLAVARAFTAGSREHEAAFEKFAKPGRLTLRSALDLDDMLRPKVQPGSTLDHVRPEEQVTIELRVSPAATIRLEGESVDSVPDREGVHSLRATIRPKPGVLQPMEIVLPTGSGASLALDASFHTYEDPRARPLETRRFVLPWAASLGTGEGVGRRETPPTSRPELAGGNWQRGRAVFFGDDAMCSRCHTLRDGTITAAKGRIGPELTHLWQRDYASLRKDVLNPSAALNPDHLAFAIRLADGRELSGVPRGEADGTIVVGEPGGKETRIRASEIVAREPLAISIMPSGLQNVLSETQLKDLFTYLLTPPLEPAPIAIDGAPPPRKLADLASIIPVVAKPEPKSGATKAGEARPFRVVLVAGPKDHGPDEHDYPDWQQRWSRLLALADGVEVEVAEGWPSKDQLERAHVLAMYSANPAWSAARAGELDPFLEHGGGLVLIHYAVNGRDAVPEFAQRIGLAWRDGASRFRHGPVDLELAAAEHAITSGLPSLRFVDETYWNLEDGAAIGKAPAITSLATSREEGAATPQLWVREAGRGRVFVSLLGHYRWTFDDPFFRLLLLRGIAWAGRAEVERLDLLSTIGARVDER